MTAFGGLHLVGIFGLGQLPTVVFIPRLGSSEFLVENALQMLIPKATEIPQGQKGSVG